MTRRTLHTFRATVAAALVFSACAADDGVDRAEVSQTIRIVANEFDFVPDVVPEIAAGDSVRFIVTNGGALIHEMQVLDGTGRVLGRTEELAPGASEELVVTFDDEGLHQVICDVDDHLMLGQRAIFSVAAG